MGKHKRGRAFDCIVLVKILVTIRYKTCKQAANVRHIHSSFRGQCVNTGITDILVSTFSGEKHNITDCTLHKTQFD